MLIAMLIENARPTIRRRGVKRGLMMIEERRPIV
jgi:hypothetical protein